MLIWKGVFLHECSLLTHDMGSRELGCREGVVLHSLFQVVWLHGIRLLPRVCWLCYTSTWRISLYHLKWVTIFLSLARSQRLTQHSNQYAWLTGKRHEALNWEPSFAMLSAARIIIRPYRMERGRKQLNSPLYARGYARSSPPKLQSTLKDQRSTCLARRSQRNYLE